MKKKNLNSKLSLQKNTIARLMARNAQHIRGGDAPETCNGGRFSLCMIIESNACPSRPACYYPTLQPDCITG